MLVAKQPNKLYFWILLTLIPVSLWVLSANNHALLFLTFVLEKYRLLRNSFSFVFLVYKHVEKNASPIYFHLIAFTSWSCFKPTKNRKWVESSNTSIRKKPLKSNSVFRARPSLSWRKKETIPSHTKAMEDGIWH